MEKIKLEYKFNNSIAEVTLDDGKGNVLDHIMVEELDQMLDSFAENNDLKLIIFQGAGKHFSFGASVEEHQKDYAAAMLRSFHKLFYQLRDLAIPTAAKISGQCLGGGLELALMCNFMFADKTAKMGQPEIALGVYAPAGSVLLPEKIGYAKAEELLITGKIISSTEADKIGLLNALYENKDEMNDAVNKWIEQYILPKSASSLRYAVKAARIKFNHIFNNFLPQVEAMYVSQLMETTDANEGITSFLEKREAVWTNN
jgi:cyclohexa-1,5-dienecarbonyl-CoA hydratase